MTTQCCHSELWDGRCHSELQCDVPSTSYVPWGKIPSKNTHHVFGTGTGAGTTSSVAQLQQNMQVAAKTETEKFMLEEGRRTQLLQENLELKARLRNVLQYMNTSSKTPAMTHAMKLLPVLSEMDQLPKVDYKQLLDSQIEKNGHLIQ